MLLRAHDLDKLEQMENVRVLAYFSVLPHLKNATTLTEFWPLPTDPGMTKQEKAQAQERLAELQRDALEAWGKQEMARRKAKAK